MKNLKKKAFFGVFWTCAATIGCLGAEIDVGLAGNAYVTAGSPLIDKPEFNGNVGGIALDDSGLRGWENPAAAISVFFSVERPQKDVVLSLVARGNAVYEVSVGGKTFRVPVSDSDFKKISVGKVSLPNAGYNRVDIRGVEKTGETFGEISEVCLDGVEGEAFYVRDFSNYWGRRGPSVNITYDSPAGEDIEYFYNEVFVPEGNDVVGTYYMACGFIGGYLGMQAVSEKERIVLFSVWGPTDEQNPARVPADERVLLRKKGEGVRVQAFGGEGTGGQSILRYPWRTGTRYKFLVRARPTEGNMTEFTGYFFSPEENSWRLIASFRRPKTQTWLVSPYSFLENFSTDLGWKSREVFFGNQWLRDKNGRWHEAASGRFGIDGTGKRNVRVDYFGGVSADKTTFHLKNCGFFNGNVAPDTYLERRRGGNAPQIDFASLDSISK